MAKKKKNIFTFARVRTIDRVLLAKHLAIALKAGLSITEALQINIDQAGSALMKAVLTQVRESVESGTALADSLKQYPSIFPNIFINVVQAGEASGTLEDNLDYLATQLQKEFDLRKKVQGAMIYPGIILSATVVLSIALSVILLPKLTKLFESFGEDIPFITKILLVVTNFLQSNWLFVSIGLVVLVILYFVLRKFAFFKNFIDEIILRIPVIGVLQKNTLIARMTRTLGTLLQSGVPITEALEITANTMENARYEKIINKVAENVKSGDTIYSVIKNEKKYLFPITAQMINMGEKTGNLEKTLIYLAKFFEKEVFTLANNLATSLEPLLIVLVAFGVGFVAVAIISPVYKLTGSLHRYY